MRKSSRVTLVLIGIAALAGCSRAPDQNRQVYATREDCLSDWGNKPSDCQPATEPTHAAQHYWYGPILPSYYGSSGWSSARSLGTTSASGTSSTITRSGFGSTARSSSSSSSGG